jgi:hypothetical protein
MAESDRKGRPRRRRRTLITLIVVAVLGIAVYGTYKVLFPAHPTFLYRVENGKPAAMTQWPATFIFEANGKRVCTATAIGPSVVLTAAHCFVGINKDADGTAEAHIERPGADNALLRVICTANPDYTFKESTPDPNDIALCRLPGGARFSNWAIALGNTNLTVMAQAFLNNSPWYETLGQQTVSYPNTILLIGYGCTTQGQPTSWVLSYNFASITSTPNSSSGNYYITNGDSGGGTVCPGDSGGAAYYGPTWVKINGDTGPNPRRIFAVNTAVNPGAAGEESDLAPVTTNAFRKWATKWANGEQICGLDGNNDNCR